MSAYQRGTARGRRAAAGGLAPDVPSAATDGIGPDVPASGVDVGPDVPASGVGSDASAVAVGGVGPDVSPAGGTGSSVDDTGGRAGFADAATVILPVVPGLVGPGSDLVGPGSDLGGPGPDRPAGDETEAAPPERDSTGTMGQHDQRGGVPTPVAEAGAAGAGDAAAGDWRATDQETRPDKDA